MRPSGEARAPGAPGRASSEAHGACAGGSRTRAGGTLAAPGMMWSCPWQSVTRLQARERTCVRSQHTVSHVAAASSSAHARPGPFALTSLGLRARARKSPGRAPAPAPRRAPSWFDTRGPGVPFARVCKSIKSRNRVVFIAGRNKKSCIIVQIQRLSEYLDTSVSRKAELYYSTKLK